MVPITGLWINKDKNGNSYMSGSMGMGRILIFKNDKKEDGSNQPDYYMKLAEKTKQQENEPEKTDDSIPF